jgi:hypothetical protein
MTIAVSDQVQLAAIKESTYGEQVTGSNLQLIRFTGESLTQNQSTTVSAEIRPDRQVSNIVRTNLNAQGDLNFELSAKSYDDFLKSALMADSTWSAEVADIAADITISASDTDNSFNDSGSGFGNYVAGEWIYVTGFTEAANNGYFKIVSQAVGKLVVSGGTLVTEIAGDSIDITQLGSITNGKTSEFWNLEREYTDLTNELALFTGIMFDTLALEFAVEAIISGTFGTLGKREQSIASSGGIGYDAAETTTPMNAVDDIGKVLENDVSVQLTSASLSLANNLRARSVLGELGAISVGAGKVTVTGSIQAYYESKTIYDKFLNQTESGLALIAKDAAGNALIFEMPKLKYQEGSRPASGENEDVMADLSFTAYMDPTENITIRIARLVA